MTQIDPAKEVDVDTFVGHLNNALQFLKQGPSSNITTDADPISTIGQHAPKLSAPGVAGTAGTLNGAGSGQSGQDQDSFYQALLTKLGMPVTGANMQFMRAWNQAEGMDSSHFNPFATTQGASGASDINSVGVKSYTSFDQGVDATAQTLQNGLYQGILDALQSGTDPMAAANAVAASPWGTGTLVQRVLGG